MGTDGVIFLFNSVDRDRIGQGNGSAHSELHKICQEDELRDAIILIFANKQDLPGALTVDEISRELELNKIRNKEWYVQACSATDGTDYMKVLIGYATHLIKSHEQNNKKCCFF